MAKNLLDINFKFAENFFYRSESYFDAELPKYIHFTKMLWAIRNEYKKPNSSVQTQRARGFDDANYAMFTNKDGKLAWRKLQIINPVLYVELISKITEESSWGFIKKRLNILRSVCKSSITCTSIPIVESRNKKSIKASQILEWWETTEQASLAHATKYCCMFTADITDCYPSIYTHTISWALHNKKVAKSNHDISLIGNFIDKKIQNLQNGQTNGIPQGAVVMALIAEIVLAYADKNLFCKLKKKNIGYNIIRYRDDYKIFTNSQHDGEVILKELTTVLMELNLKLNTSKTCFYDDIISGSIKKDKFLSVQYEKSFSEGTIQKRLIKIFNFLQIHPNSKQMCKYLSLLSKTLMKNIAGEESQGEINPKALMGMLVQIAYKNPALTINCCQMISITLLSLEEEKAKLVIEEIKNKFKTSPHSSVMRIFLQRIGLPYGVDENFDEKLCDIIKDEICSTTCKNMNLWNTGWVQASTSFKRVMNNQKFIYKNIILNLKKNISGNEVDIFDNERAS